MAFDPASLLLIVAAFYWSSLIADMKRLHRPPRISETIQDAATSTYRSIPTERAFRLAGCYLPASGLVVLAYQAPTEMTPVRS